MPEDGPCLPDARGMARLLLGLHLPDACVAGVAAALRALDDHAALVSAATTERDGEADR